MKTVVKANMVAHLWAHQTQAEARCGGGNFFFRDTTIYSYGAHFPIAKHVKGTRGRRAILFTTRNYSVTTSGHKSDVRRAIPSDATVFYVEDVQGTKQENLDALAKSLQTLTLDVKRRRNKGAALDALRAAIDHANRYAEFVGSRRRFGIPDTLDVAQAEQLAEAYREQEKRQEQAKERKKKQLVKEQLEKAREDLAAWLDGAAKRPHFPYECEEHNFAYLRLRPDDPDVVETSMGAEFPRSHCSRLIALVRSGIPYQHNGHSEYAGVFRIDRIDEQGNVKAGCHNVTRAECERFAAVLGL